MIAAVSASLAASISVINAMIRAIWCHACVLCPDDSEAHAQAQKVSIGLAAVVGVDCLVCLVSVLAHMATLVVPLQSLLHLHHLCQLLLHRGCGIFGSISRYGEIRHASSSSIRLALLTLRLQ